MRRVVGELLEGVQLHALTEDLAVEGECLAGGAGKLDVGRQCGHGLDRR